ncbi:hypothetical protein NUW54_g13440 [Trametes sanguinea]|uniref:Uncharacterized protein n=1 Tax=Trametes sanguinea TaxID=158606 RepID=A0ACC1MN09_9APHY|nr:hypothetical protein NUW54_g13440 [Trametes sanguinea]
MDYRTQATPQPGPHHLVAGFVEDESSDDDNHVVINDYAAHPRAALKAFAYHHGRSLDREEAGSASPNARAHTPYDNDFPDDFGEPNVQLSPEAQANSNTHSVYSSPQSVVSYAPHHVRASVCSNSPLPEESDSRGAEHYRKARRVVEAPEGSRQRARKRDYEPEAQEVLHDAAIIFKSMICSKNAYPNKLNEKTWSVDAWHAAAAKLDIKLAPTNETLGLVAQYSWHLRSEIKNAARALVPGAYSLKAGLTPQSRLFNQERVAFLHRARTFAYEIIGDTAQDCVGLYEAEIIQAIVNNIFYKSATDDGVVLSDVYEPFPFVGLALILTAVQCSLDEWDTGAFARITFSEENYVSVYRGHLEELRYFEAQSGADRILSEICGNISMRGR